MSWVIKKMQIEPQGRSMSWVIKKMQIEPQGDITPSIMIILYVYIFWGGY
jgi:hypothetical protein